LRDGSGSSPPRNISHWPSLFLTSIIIIAIAHHFDKSGESPGTPWLAALAYQAFCLYNFLLHSGLGFCIITTVETNQEVKDMPQIKSAIKRVKTQEASRENNMTQMSSMRTAIKKFKVAAENGADNAQDLLKAATRAIDMANSKGLIHKNKAGRDKSRLSALIK